MDAHAGALAGSLHGDTWLPPRWLTALENGASQKGEPPGRDEVLQLIAPQLSLLDVRSVVRVPRGIIMSATELSHGSRVVGVLIGSMCGDVLGAGVEGWRANKILKRFPKGLVDFLRTQRG